MSQNKLKSFLHYLNKENTYGEKNLPIIVITSTELNVNSNFKCIFISNVVIELSKQRSCAPTLIVCYSTPPLYGLTDDHQIQH